MVHLWHYLLAGMCQQAGDNDILSPFEALNNVNLHVGFMFRDQELIHRELGCTLFSCNSMKRFTLPNFVLKVW